MENTIGSYADIREILVRRYAVKAEAITPEASMTALGLDSLSIAELLFDVSDKYHIDIPTDNLQLNTLGEAAALVDELVRKKGT